MFDHVEPHPESSGLSCMHAGHPPAGLQALLDFPKRGSYCLHEDGRRPQHHAASCCLRSCHQLYLCNVFHSMIYNIFITIYATADRSL